MDNQKHTPQPIWKLILYAGALSGVFAVEQLFEQVSFPYPPLNIPKLGYIFAITLIFGLVSNPFETYLDKVDDPILEMALRYGYWAIFLGSVMAIREDSMQFGSFTGLFFFVVIFLFQVYKYKFRQRIIDEYKQSEEISLDKE